MKTIYTFDHISLNSFRMGNISGKIGRENQITHFVLNNFFFPENPVFCEIHSFSSLSYDRSKASSKASSPHSASQSFLFQMRVSSPFLKVIQ